jgi:hypothetical protein
VIFIDTSIYLGAITAEDLFRSLIFKSGFRLYKIVPLFSILQSLKIGIFKY